MAVTFDAASTAGLNGLSAVSINHTCTGSNRLLLCFVSYAIPNGTETISSIFFNTTDSLTQWIQVDVGTLRTEIWYLVAPAAVASAVDITFSEGVKARIGNMSFAGVDQTTPIDTAQSATGTSTAPTIDVVSATGNFVADGMGALNTPTATVGAGQTQRYNGTGGTAIRGAGSTEAGAASVTMSWTLSTSQDWAIAAVDINAAADAAAKQVIMMIAD